MKRSLRSVRRLGLSMAIPALVLTGMTGCDVFRSTRPGYYPRLDASTKQPLGRLDQVRQREVVKVAVYETTASKNAAGGIKTFAPALAALAAVVIEKAVAFGVDRLKERLELVASLHEQSYSGTAVVGQFNPRSTYEVHVTRWVASDPSVEDQSKSSDQSETKLKLAARDIYQLEPAEMEGGKIAIIVRPVDKSKLKGEPRTELNAAAVRLLHDEDPFSRTVTLTFYTAGKDAPSTQQPDASDSARANAGAGATGSDDKPAVQIPKRAPIGGPLTHQRTMNIERGSRFVVPEDTTKPKDTTEPEDTTKLAGGDSIGFFVTDDHLQVLEIAVSVNEKDPSKAAERNTQIKNDLKDITGPLTEYVKAVAGVAKQEEAKDGKEGN